MAVTLEGPVDKVWAALAVGESVGEGGVGVEQNRRDVAKGPRLPRGSMVKGEIARW